MLAPDKKCCKYSSTSSFSVRIVGEGVNFRFFNTAIFAPISPPLKGWTLDPTSINGDKSRQFILTRALTTQRGRD